MAEAPRSTTGAKGSEKVPRYMQVAGELRRAILAGRYTNGRPFPTETALCGEFDVSRFTVREALKRLQTEGLIARKRGSGTTVQPAAARGGALHQPLSNMGELLQYARDSEVTYEEHESGDLPDHVAEQIAQDTAGTWRWFRGSRRQNDEALPIAVTDAYFHERLGKAVDQIDPSAGTMFDQIEKLAKLRLVRVTQDIQAIGASAEIAKALDMKKGTPILRIIRCYLGPKGTVHEISVSHHPGDRFAYAMQIDMEG